MNRKIYNLSEGEKQRLVNAVRATLSIPLIDGLEDFIWEVIFCYTKDIDVVDPLFGIRSKKLFDIVDSGRNIGWSAKALQCNAQLVKDFEVVIQRADIIGKRDALGFPILTIDSDPNMLGAALLRHWHDKVEGDAADQGVVDKRICMLIKSPLRLGSIQFTYYEEEIASYTPDEISWRWTNAAKIGLQGVRIVDNFCVYRWYPNQKQFFERFRSQYENYTFSIEPQRVALDEIVDFLNKKNSRHP